VGGGRERKILIEMDQHRMEAYGLNIRELDGQDRRNNNEFADRQDRGQPHAIQYRVMGQYPDGRRHQKS